MSEGYTEIITPEKLRDNYKNRLGNLDKAQTSLTVNGCELNTFKLASYHHVYSIMDKKIVLCPFCLCYNEINKFLVLTSKGKVNQSLGKCPKCDSDLKLETLDSVINMNLHDFAYWVYRYRLNGFWDKVSGVEKGLLKGSEESEKRFKDWCRKANNLSDNEKEGLGFWEYYRLFKGNEEEKK